MIDLGNCLLYGAYGYTGELAARLAIERGLKPVLAGRSQTKLEPLATELGLPFRVVGLDDPAALDAALDGIDVVVHCAGPFVHTCRPMVDACLRTKTHYVDITGEIVVFETCARRDAEAKEAGIVLMPGAGFDVVPSDCLAAHLHRRLPEATHLTLAFASFGGGLSHGTATTMVENLGAPSAIRRDGRITPVPMGSQVRDIDFGRGPTSCMGIPWGDVSTAWYSTKIPNIEVFTKIPAKSVRIVRLSASFAWLMKTNLVRSLGKRWVDSQPAGPDESARSNGFTVLYGEARAGDTTVSTRQRVPEGYTLTAATALESAVRLLAGGVEAGYRTPSMAFGPDFILDFDGTERTDLD